VKAVLALAVLLILGAAAMAKPAPIDRSAKVVSPEDSAVAIGGPGAKLESDYFRAPQAPSASRVFPCRLQLHVFEKTRLAQSCN
jgi:hypothetical protein